MRCGTDVDTFKGGVHHIAMVNIATDAARPPEVMLTRADAPMSSRR
jgi:hypothetical protein